MAEYVSLPIETDPDLIAQDAFDYLVSIVAGWEPHDGQFEVWLIEALSQAAAESRDVASDVPPDIFRYLGQFLYGIPPIDAQAASVASTWTVIDAAGYTIPDGTVVGIPASGNVNIPFAVAGDVIIPAGSTATATGEVILEAISEGEDANDLSGTPILVDNLDFVQTIALEALTANGADEEDIDTYLNRLSSELRLLSPAPILASDFADLYRTRVDEVYRATALDNYDPGPPVDAAAERFVTVVGIKEDGTAVSAAAKAEGIALLQSLRESTFEVRAIDPTYSTVDVNATVVAQAGFDLAEVDAAATAALTDFLNPANWGLLVTSEDPVWNNIPVVRLTDAIALLETVNGVDHVVRVGFNYGPEKAVTFAAATGLITSVAHGYVIGDVIRFVDITGGAPPYLGNTYYVVGPVAADTFKIARNAGGAAIGFANDGTGVVSKLTGTATHDINGDLELTGVVPLPQAGVITVTVTP